MVLAWPSVVPAQEAAPAVDAPPTVNAVWVEREIQMTYMGFTTYYSCDGLRDKVVLVLRELGVRPGFKVTTRGCTHLTGPEVMPGVRIVATVPVEATPEVLGRIAADASKRELAARATGQAAAAAEATAQFPARVKRVEFRSGGTSRFDHGDCELLEHLRDRVFGPLGVKVVEERLNCVPHQATLIGVALTVEVLEPLPAPAAGP